MIDETIVETNDETTNVVYKITIFATPKQWDSLSKWSATCSSALDPWLMLIHDGDMSTEYSKRLKEINQCVKGETVYTTT